MAAVTRSLCGLLAFLAVLTLMPDSQLQAQQTSPTRHPVSVVMVIDDSGSMSSCWPWEGRDPAFTDGVAACRAAGFDNPPSDFQELRYSAVRLLLLLADEEDRLAVIRFNSRVQDELKGFATIGDPASRRQLLARIKPPTEAEYKAQGGQTRIDLGIEAARDVITSQPQGGRPVYVIFLTDGKPYPNESSQEPRVVQVVRALQRQGAVIFPVVLCNPTAGCEGREFLARTMAQTEKVREARTASDLLRVFSEIFAEVKPNLQIVLSDPGATNPERLVLRIRPSQGVRQVNLVTTVGALRSLAFQDQDRTQSVPNVLEGSDDNVAVYSEERGQFPEGAWVAETADSQSFFVVKTLTYPRLVFPPSSIPGSVVAPHYYPQQKPPVLVAKIEGPAAGEALQYLEIGNSPVSQYRTDFSTGGFEPLNPQKTLWWKQISSSVGRFALEVGQGTGPLRIVRVFTVKGQPGLPTLQVSSSVEGRCNADEGCALEVGFAPGPEVQIQEAYAYVADASEGGRPIAEFQMACSGRTCRVDAASSFVPKAGHSYTIRYLVTGRSGDVVFGDWAEDTLTLAPAVRVLGLPNPLDICDPNQTSWPVRVVASTTEDLGRLTAVLNLRRMDTGEAVAGVNVAFSVEIVGAGELPAAPLRVLGADTLRPGDYEGTLTFQVERQPTSKAVRIPAPISVFCRKALPKVALDATDIDFGEVARGVVDVSRDIPAMFSGPVFNLRAEASSANCPELEIIAAPPREAANGHLIPIRLRSNVAVSSKICTGTVTLIGQLRDSQVEPSQLTWRVAIVGPQMRIDTKAVEFKGFAGLPEDAAKAQVKVFYSGRLPFRLAVASFEARRIPALLDFLPLLGQVVKGLPVQSQSPITLDDVEVRTPVVETPAEAGKYQVDLDLVPKRALPAGRYSGAIALTVEGLEDEIKPVSASVRFRSPNFIERHVLPPLKRVYNLPWPGLCTGPLTLFGILSILWVLRERSTRPEEEASPLPGPPPEAFTPPNSKPPQPRSKPRQMPSSRPPTSGPPRYGSRSSNPRPPQRPSPARGPSRSSSPRQPTRMSPPRTTPRRPPQAPRRPPPRRTPGGRR